RRALGSGGGALARLVLVETLLLSAVGGGVGLALASAVTSVLSGMEVQVLAALGPLALDPTVFAFTAGVTLATAFLFGTGPMLRALSSEPGAVLRDAGNRGGASRFGGRLRAGLVAAEVALALLLLVGVGATLRSFWQLTSVDPGFEPEGVLAASFELPAQGYGGAERTAFYRQLVERVRGLPGVEEAGLTYALPLEGTVWSASFDRVDPRPDDPDVPLGGNMRPVSPGYFRAMGIELVEGRDLRPSDGPGTAPVVVVDRAVAERAWPGRSPLGERITLQAFSGAAPATVVGVVGDVRDQGLAQPGSGHVYFPIYQRPMRRSVLVVRGTRAPLSLAPAVRRAIREADSRIPVFQLQALGDHVARTVAGPRLGLVLVTGFGVVALLLAAVGIYGVLSYSVARRTAEMGTRIALGAEPRRVVWLVVRQVMGMWAWGTAAGLLAAFLLASSLRAALYRADPWSPATVLTAAFVLGAVALVSSLVPAWRAASVDCVEALRTE
ncbi:MAG TPA: FtsX-like permease family protein, partial [Longimicrobiales bacterium]|nr:FtsX-like permease family protein [Longimicrobiales bacterium]